jgi:hypothetical protein
MKLLKESLLILALGLSLSSATTSGETSFTVKPGAYPWHVWNSPVYKENFTWPEFKKQVAELNGLQNNERAFRHLARGTTLKIPALPGTTASASDIAKAKADQKAVDDAAHAVDKSLWDTEKKRLQDALNLAAGSMYKNLTFWLWVVGALFIGAGLMYFLRPKLVDETDSEEVIALRRERLSLQNTLRNRDQEIAQTRAELLELRRESDARDHFIGKYAEPYEVPNDIGSFKGKHNRIYVLRTDPIDSEPAVLLWNGTKYVTVKRKGLNKWFDEHKNDNAVLEFYGLHGGEPITKRMRAV